MKYLIRLAVAGLALTCILSIIAMVTTADKSLEHILYDELTCEELLHSYHFNITVMQDIMTYHDGCLDYIDETLDGHDHGKLTCEFIKEHATFVQGIVNDVAAVYNIKCATK